MVPGLKMGGDLRRGCRTAAAPGVKGPCSCTTIGRKAEWLWLLRLSSQPPPLRRFDPRALSPPTAPRCTTQTQRRTPAARLLYGRRRRGARSDGPRSRTFMSRAAHLMTVVGLWPSHELIFAQVSTVRLKGNKTMLQPNSQYVIINQYLCAIYFLYVIINQFS